VNTIVSEEYTLAIFMFYSVYGYSILLRNFGTHLLVKIL